MPDWSYQTVFRPVLFKLPFRVARDFALGFMGRLSRFPGGTSVIALLGHMKPDERLKLERAGLEFATPVGIGPNLDRSLLAPRALARFGVGYLELGPVTLTPVPAGRIAKDPIAENLIFEQPEENPGLESLARELEHLDRVRIFVRLRGSIADNLQIVERVAPKVAGFILCEGYTPEELETLATRIFEHERVCLLACEIDADWEQVREFRSRGLVQGIVLETSRVTPEGHLVCGRSRIPEIELRLSKVREAIGSDGLLIVSGGVHEPCEALSLIRAGADLVSVDTGIVFSGPGLPKRINEALLWEAQVSELPAPPERATRMSWLWTFLMGAGMFVGGLLAMLIAWTRVVMPYDEAQIGISRDELAAINDKLLPFMTHDRVTLSGTMFAVGILYLALSWYGSRRGMHWAQVAMASSAMCGFFSFFFFLGFGYFDPLHAFVTAVLFQFLLLSMHSDLPTYRNTSPPELTNDAAWKRSQWGQLLFIVHGAALIAAGAVISCYGMTSVFVPEDLEFMQTTAEELCGANEFLVPLVAHDRASFGGMLIATGVVILLSSLWGFRRGHWWLWWALLTAGSVAYIATIIVHWQVGYTSLKHLSPAYAGLGMLWLGCALSREQLCRQEKESIKLT
ncbi:MAG TPA: hypothetical protein VLA12_02915 [Planctomycetaceae bacterium]|nr:hypothetical protein [Planctomycetaceae bacterium]